MVGRLKSSWKSQKISHLPSSHSGGELPGNHNGLSGGSGSQTLDTPFVAFRRTLPGNHVVNIRGKCLEDISLYPNRKCKWTDTSEWKRQRQTLKRLKSQKSRKTIAWKRWRNLFGRLENAEEANVRAIVDRGSNWAEMTGASVLHLGALSLHGKMKIQINYLVGTGRKMEEQPIVVEVHTCSGYGVLTMHHCWAVVGPNFTKPVTAIFTSMTITSHPESNSIQLRIIQ